MMLLYMKILLENIYSILSFAFKKFFNCGKLLAIKKNWFSKSSKTATAYNAKTKMVQKVIKMKTNQLNIKYEQKKLWSTFLE